LLAEVGPVHYQRVDLRLSRPIAKAEMTEMLTRKAPKEIAGQTVREVNDRDGIKYVMADDSWLLIRPSGTEPVLRVYAEGRTQEMIKSLIGFGRQIAESVA
jgi:phosphomannomutase